MNMNLKFENKCENEAINDALLLTAKDNALLLIANELHTMNETLKELKEEVTFLRGERSRL